MKAEHILIFLPVRTTWGKFEAVRRTPLIRVSATDPALKKTVAKIANGLKNRLTEVAFAIATLFAVIYSVITYPYRLYRVKTNEPVTIRADIKRIEPKKQTHVELQLKAYFYKHRDHFNTLTEDERTLLIDRVTAQCVRSQAVFSPIAKLFVDHLLETAHKEGKKLIFMARDGLSFYEIAKKLMETKKYRDAYPSLAKDGAIGYGYFSRKLVKDAKSSEENRKIFNRYVTENLKIQPGERCIFADIGFAGSMTGDIRSMLPHNPIEFEFLIATSNKAKGFFANIPDQPLEDFDSAGNTAGTPWMEETHHGTLASGVRLIENAKGKVEVVFDPKGIPSKKHPEKIRTDEKYSLPYLIRKFCLKAVVQHAASLGASQPLPLPETEFRTAMATHKKAFSELMRQLQSGALPMHLGWEK